MAPSTSSGLQKLQGLNTGLEKTLQALKELDKLINKGVELKLNNSLDSQIGELKKAFAISLDSEKVGAKLGTKLTQSLKAGLEQLELKAKLDTDSLDVKGFADELAGILNKVQTGFDIEFDRLAAETVTLLNQLSSITQLQLDNSTFLFVHQLRNAQAALMKFEAFFDEFKIDGASLNVETESEESALNDFGERLRMASAEINDFLAKLQNQEPPNFDRLQQRIDELKLPDFNKILSIDSGGANINDIAADLIDFGNTLGQSNTELLAEFSDLRDKIFQLGSTAKESTSDLDAFDLLTLKITELANEVNETIGKFRNISADDILKGPGEELAKTVTGLKKKIANIVNSLDKLQIGDVSIDTDGINQVLERVRRNLEGLENLKISASVAGLNENVVSIDLSTKELKTIVDSLVGSAEGINVNEEKLKDVVATLFFGLKAVSEGLAVAAPFFDTINSISDNAGNLGPLVKSLASSLPPLEGGLESVVSLLTLNAKGLTLLSQASADASQKLAMVPSLETEPLDKLLICASNAAEALCKASDKVIEFQANLANANINQSVASEELIAQIKAEVAEREAALRKEIAAAQAQSREARQAESIPDENFPRQTADTDAVDEAVKEIDEGLEKLVKNKASAVEAELAKEEAAKLGPELEARLKAQEKAVQDAIIERVIRGLSNFAIKRIAGVTDDSQVISDFPEIQDAINKGSKIKSGLTQTPNKRTGELNARQKRKENEAILAVEDSLVGLLQESEDGFARLQHFLKETVDKEIRTQGGSSDQQLSRERLRGVFNKDTTDSVFGALGPTDAIDTTSFINDEFLEKQLKPLIKETRAQINALSSEINEFAGSLLAGEADLLDYERNTLKIQELRKEINQLLVLTEQVNQSGAVSDKARASFNRGTKSFATQKSKFAETTFENLLPLAQGQQIPENQLQQILNDFDKIREQAERQLTDSEELGDKYILGILAGIDRSFPQLIDEATGKTKQLLIDLKAAFETKSIESEAEETGEEYSRGIAKGILKEAKKAIEAAKDVAEDIIDEPKDDLEIASPSKKAEREIGEPYGQGVVKGIQRQIPKVKQAIEKLAELFIGEDITQPLKKKRVFDLDDVVKANPPEKKADKTQQVESTGKLTKVTSALNAEMQMLEGSTAQADFKLESITTSFNKASKEASSLSGDAKKLNDRLDKTGMVLKSLKANFDKGFKLGTSRRNIKQLADELGKLKRRIAEQNPVLGIFGETFRDIFFGGLAVIGVTQLGDAVIEFGRAVASTTIEVERLSTSLEFITGSNLGRIFAEDTANKFNLSLKDTLNNFQQLAQATRNTRLEGAKTEELFTAISKSSIVLGRSQEQQAGIIRQLGQSLNKGKLLAEEINTLAENGLNIRAALSKSLGKTASETSKLIEDGQIGLTEIFDAVILLGEETDSGLNAALNNTNGLLNKARNIWVGLLLEVGEKLKPIINVLLKNAIIIIESLLQSVRDLAPTFKAVFDILRTIFFPLEAVVRGFLEVVKLLLPAFDLVFRKSGLLKGAFTALALIITAKLGAAVVGLATSTLPLLLTSLGAVLKSMSAIAVHPVGLALITIGLAAAALTNDMSGLSTGLKVLSTALTVVIAAISKAAIAAAVTNPALAGMLIAIVAVTAGLIQFSIWAKDVTNAVLGLDQAVIDFNSNQQVEERNAKLNRSFQSLSKGVALTKDEFGEVIGILEKEIEMNKRAGNQNNGLEKSNRKLIASIKERQAEAERFTKRQDDLGKAIDKTSQAFERQIATFNKAKEGSSADIAEQLEKDQITAEEASEKQVNLEIETNEKLLQLNKDRVAELKAQIAERDEIKKRFPLFELNPKELEKRKQLDADLLKAETTVNQKRVAVAKGRADRQNDIEEKANKKISDELEKRTKEVAKQQKAEEIINQRRLLNNEASDEEITLSAARSALKRNARLMEIEKKRIADINALEDTDDKDILEKRAKAIEDAESKIQDLTLQGISNQKEIRSATDALISEQFDDFVNAQERALTEASIASEEQAAMDKKLLADRLITKEDFEQKQAEATRNRIQSEIEAERAKLEKLESVSFLDPEKEENRAKQILDIRKNISDKTVELIDSEISHQERVNEKTKKLLKDRTVLMTLQLEKQTSAIQDEINKFDSLIKGQERALTLSKARSELVQADLNLQGALIESEKQRFESQIGREEKAEELQKRRQELRESGDKEGLAALEKQIAQDAKRAEFDKRIAENRKQALIEQQKADAEARVIEQEREQIAARRLVFEQQIAVIKGQQALLEAQAGLQDALLGGNTVEIAQAIQKLELSEKSLMLNEKLLGQAKDEQELLKESSKLSDEKFKKDQKAERIKFRTSTNANFDDDIIGSGFDNKDSGFRSKRSRNTKRNSLEQDFGLGAGFTDKNNQTLEQLKGSLSINNANLITAMEAALQSDAIVNNLLKVVKANENSATKISNAIGNIPTPVSNPASSTLNETAGLG